MSSFGQCRFLVPHRIGGSVRDTRWTRRETRSFDMGATVPMPVLRVLEQHGEHHVLRRLCEKDVKIHVRAHRRFVRTQETLCFGYALLHPGDEHGVDFFFAGNHLRNRRLHGHRGSREKPCPILRPSLNAFKRKSLTNSLLMWVMIGPPCPPRLIRTSPEASSILMASLTVFRPTPNCLMRSFSGGSISSGLSPPREFVSRFAGQPLQTCAKGP